MDRPLKIPPVDKDALIGSCVRLGIPVELTRLRQDLAAIPNELWGSRGGRVGVHLPTEAIFLRGYAPAEGDRPIEDRDALALTPYICSLIETVIPAPPMRCLLAKLNPLAVIAPHIDRNEYFAGTIRLHFPIVTDPSVAMISCGMAFQMKEGEAWALNNSNVHAVVSDWSQARIHLICDFLPSPGLRDLIMQGERGLGRPMASLTHRFARLPVADPPK